MTNNSITFYGGAGGVTGSKHLVEINNFRLLLDCGTFQGLSDVRERNRSLPFPPESIDAVVLSHAHIDHCGMLPLLVKRGFTGPIYSTPATKDVAALMMADMAGIEHSDAEYRKKHKIGSPDEREPLFTQDDVDITISNFVPVPYARQRVNWTHIDKDINLKFYDAGHILGSAVSVINYPKEEFTLAFTGDLGPPGMPLLHDPETPEEEIDLIISESTYGSRRHEKMNKALSRLASAIARINKRSGKIIIPAFSLGRTQVIVYLLHQLFDAGKIPRLPIYVDSPLAADLTKVYRKHRREYDNESWADFAGTNNRPLAFKDLKYVQSRDQSIKLNSKKEPLIIISASGMMTAGRVVHHLKHTLADKRNAVFITGYQAKGTMGRSILEGAKMVDIYGKRIPVAAEIILFNEFSAHADRDQLQGYLQSIKGLSQVILVHGEPHQADDLKAQLAAKFPNWQITRPDEGDIYPLGS